ncbi:hypothetical protein [Kribbella sp. NPDC049584]|uniref:hypothetical protein n=1 Tax=Kribbella sp. NPDC049584 TaxID=3154833 RepID=UPI003428822A
MTVAKTSESVSGAIGTLGIVSLAGVPVAAARSSDVSVGWPLAGAASWALALLLKRAAAGTARRPALIEAVRRGAISAVTELGCSALVFAVRQPPGGKQAVAFGAGAGGAEALYVLALGIAHPADAQGLEQWRAGRQQSLIVDQFVLIERTVAMVSHIASRGIVSTSGSRPGRLSAGLVLFTVADAVAAYGHAAGWKWMDPRVARRTHAFYAAVAALESYLFRRWSAL